MTKAVLTTKISPTYDDLPEERYNFPRTYINQISQAIDDWIIYYEPRRPSGDPSSKGGRQSYFAAARLVSVIPDQKKSDTFYALVEDYLEFDRPVPFKENGYYHEASLRKADGSTSKGQFGRAVRLLPDEEFERILQSGFVDSIDFSDNNQEATGIDEVPFPGFNPERMEISFEVSEQEDRRLISSISERPFRIVPFPSRSRRHTGTGVLSVV